MDIIKDRVEGGAKLILIVDDDKMIIKMVSEALKIFGYNVIGAESGFKAIDILKKAYIRDEKKSEFSVREGDGSSLISPDLIVLDVNMPDMRGGELLDKMKEIEPELKVLVSTGSDMNSEVKEIMKRGCSGFIQKPFTISELDHKIKSILRSP